MFTQAFFIQLFAGLFIVSMVGLVLRDMYGSARAFTTPQGDATSNDIEVVHHDCAHNEEPQSTPVYGEWGHPDPSGWTA